MSLRISESPIDGMWKSSLMSLYDRFRQVEEANLTVKDESAYWAKYRYPDFLRDKDRPFDSMRCCGYDITFAMANIFVNDPPSANSITHYAIFEKEANWPSHTFSIQLANNNVFYMVEPVFSVIRGIWAADYRQDLFNFVVSALGYDVEGGKVKLVEYNPLLPELSGKTTSEFLQYLDTRYAFSEWYDEIYQVRCIYDGRNDGKQ